MENNLKNNLEIMCQRFTDKLESLLSNYPVGTCYLIGHCMAEGLIRAGYTARKVTGTVIFKDKNEKNIIYGKSISKGKNIGIYHTWCVLEIDTQTIIIDPSYKYNKIAIREYYGTKPNKNIHDFIITDNANQWLHRYSEDLSLNGFSTKCLQSVDHSLINQLVDEVKNSSSELLVDIQTFV
ncbi:hypothetical protein DVK85_06175 [Flavobacterium arcticum]|uniref:Uncharacterized protein n=1 Tax=Flavobacterium arcticum TaxID=1784713 RepID=A0A345HB86_9FLAO|nr:hypothetical protein [Flavobacterium arcticum]AXG73846.1 hypothetical protein DVK85_06175 [Flavobacterium arcticum]KAF2511799.1 hypothetical protein E0W72_05695 [Flavobacterium arcticum]